MTNFSGRISGCQKSFDVSREIAPLNPVCIACGPANPCGLHINFRCRNDRVYASWSPTRDWASFEGTIHGGIVSTVLDEAMSKAVIAAGYEALTAELRVRFRVRIAPGDRLNVTSWLVEKRRGLITAEAQITGEDGQERARGWGKFLVARSPNSTTAPFRGLPTTTRTKDDD